MSAPIPAFPENPTVAQLQSYIHELVAARGFTTDSNQVFVLLNEEIGEVAKEIRRTWKHGVDANREALGAELADVLFYLIDLANLHGIDLTKAASDKAAHNETRAHFSV